MYKTKRQINTSICVYDVVHVRYNKGRHIHACMYMHVHVPCQVGGWSPQAWEVQGQRCSHHQNDTVPCLIFSLFWGERERGERGGEGREGERERGREGRGREGRGERERGERGERGREGEREKGERGRKGGRVGRERKGRVEESESEREGERGREGREGKGEGDRRRGRDKQSSCQTTLLTITIQKALPNVHVCTCNCPGYLGNH